MQNSSQIITTNKPTANILQAGCPSCRPTNNVTALKGKVSHSMDLLISSSPGVFQLCLWPLIAPGYLGCHASHQPSDASTPIWILSVTCLSFNRKQRLSGEWLQGHVTAVSFVHFPVNLLTLLIPTAAKFQFDTVTPPALPLGSVWGFAELFSEYMLQCVMPF